MIKRLLTTRGFYIILFACVTIIGTSLVIRNMSRTVMDRMNTQLDDLPTFTEIIDSGNENGIEDELPPVYVPEVVTPTTAVEVAAIPVMPAAPVEITSLRKPVDGEIIKEFSGDELVFSNTMNDWRVHRGVNIAAPIGSQVRAAADGVVEQVFEDDLLGVVVVIGHGNGVHTKYASLQSADFISVGTDVRAGDIIGGVGNTAIIKSADGPLLYFEVHRNGRQVDPAGFFN